MPVLIYNIVSSSQNKKLRTHSIKLNQIKSYFGACLAIHTCILFIQAPSGEEGSSLSLSLPSLDIVLLLPPPPN